MRTFLYTSIRTLLPLACILMLASCDRMNNPYPSTQATDNIYYSDFSERPKHLDPARSYSEVEWDFIAQIYEPPLQYHYLKSPHELTTLAAEVMPTVIYYDNNGNQFEPGDPASKIAFTEYLIQIKKGVLFQPHPAFAKNSDNAYLYHTLSPDDLSDVHTLGDFGHTDTRELTADDYVFQIKRLADPRLHSPIAGLMSAYIEGLDELRKTLKNDFAQNKAIDLRDYDISGVKTVSKYSYKIRLKTHYPQFTYWLAMPFFAAVPWEAEVFYGQPGMKSRNISMDWYPVGTGAFMLSENNPNLRMVLTKNPNFHGENYPSSNGLDDVDPKLLKDAGQPLPFIDKAIYVLEKETIPRWNKFLQGYYDTSGISSDSFDQAINITSSGMALTESMEQKGISLASAIAPTTSYLGFNMLDPVVGGYSEEQRKLRRAISIAVDFEEYISIFANGRGNAAQGPIPPGIFGVLEGKNGVNPYVYNWKNEQARRKTISEAKQLMKDAGYPNGIDPKTGQNLILYYDTSAVGPDRAPMLSWYRKQFLKLGIELVVRATDYNRFQEKVRKGITQIYSWGWNADYPDPENFFFLLYGPNSKVPFHGENASNYQNARFDELFIQMRSMPNNDKRKSIINEMIGILREDAPWGWGIHPTQFGLYHSWYHNMQPKIFARNQLKYVRIDADQRANKRAQWNHPITWPAFLILAIIILSAIPALLTVKRRERARAK